VIREENPFLREDPRLGGETKRSEKKKGSALGGEQEGKGG